MPRYRVMVLREMSQSLDVYTETPQEAARWALENNDISASASDSFDDSGDERVFSIENADTNEVVWQSAESQDTSWEYL